MEAPQIDIMPFRGDLKETRKAIDDVKRAATALLGDKLLLDREAEMAEDTRQLDINPDDVPAIIHPLKPLEEEKDEILNEAALLRDTMRACLARLEDLEPTAPELEDELVKRIADIN